MKRVGRGEITKISSLFDVYKKKLIAPESSVISNFVEVVSDLYGWDIKKELCSYQSSSKILSIRCSGVLKNEILFKQEEILLHLRGRLGEKACPIKIL